MTNETELTVLNENTGNAANPTPMQELTSTEALTPRHRNNQSTFPNEDGSNDVYYRATIEGGTRVTQVCGQYKPEGYIGLTVGIESDRGRIALSGDVGTGTFGFKANGAVKKRNMFTRGLDGEVGLTWQGRETLGKTGYTSADEFYSPGTNCFTINNTNMQLELNGKASYQINNVASVYADTHLGLHWNGQISEGSIKKTPENKATYNGRFYKEPSALYAGLTLGGKLQPLKNKRLAMDAHATVYSNNRKPDVVANISYTF